MEGSVSQQICVSSSLGWAKDQNDLEAMDLKSVPKRFLNL